MVYQDSTSRHRVMGHSVFVNGNKVLTCMEHVLRPELTIMTRAVSGLIYIPSNAQVAIKFMVDQASVRLNASSTFFGLIKVLH